MGNNLDRKLCELQNPESEIVLQESKPRTLSPCLAYAADTNLLALGSPRLKFDVVEHLIECDIALAAVQIMWLLGYELMGGVLALLVFAWLCVV